MKISIILLVWTLFAIKRHKQVDIAPSSHLHSFTISVNGLHDNDSHPIV